MKLRLIAVQSFIVCSLSLFHGTEFQTIRAQQIIQVPADASTAQGGIDIASNRDTVNTAPGVYSEAINLDGKIIIIQGNAQGVTLDRSESGPAVTFDSSEMRAAVDHNVIVTNELPLSLSSVDGNDLALAAAPIYSQTSDRIKASLGEAWPSLLKLENGTPVSSSGVFEQQRRPELLQLFEENVFGKTPRRMVPVRIVDTRTDEHALQGLAVRQQITLKVGSKGERTWHLLLYIPAHAERPVPVIVGLNFDGNQTIDADPGIDSSPIWVRDPELRSVPLAEELSRHVLRSVNGQTRGSAAGRWQLHTLLERGYGLATMYAGDIEPDFLGGIGYGIRPLLFSPEQRVPKADDWGAIGAWAWGMSRIVDVLSTSSSIDPKRIIAFGFSRFGKTALWAAAQDQRFALVISNESGQAGATLSHRQQGEPIDHMMLAFPYWFCGDYQHYLGRASELPVDGHLLLALIAPRPLYVGSARSDPFSDPEGEFLAARAASSVYRLYGEKGVEDRVMPPLEHSIGDRVRYHIRPGGHDVTLYDWQQYLNFADHVLQSPQVH